MCECGCGSCEVVESESNADPSIDNYKLALKNLGGAIKSAHKTEEGKKLSAEYWLDIVSLLKKAKLGVSMMELGIDDEEEIKNTHDTSIKKVKPTPDGEKGEGGPRDGESSDSDKSTSEGIIEKSASKSQQRLFGMVHAYNKGDLKKSDVDSDLYDKVKKIASGMTKTDAEDMAKTDHSDLPETVPTDEFYDTMNHLSILLSEQPFDKIESDGSQVSINSNNRKFTIKFDDKFYMVSPDYNFELGTVSDLNEVVEKFVKLTKQSEFLLKTEYEASV
tara:strand:- start:1120 stop:1947 length:828 start_codon:yes stop_codon:yes gene_type:complete